MTSTPEPDERLIDARDLALAALHEITPPSTVGPAAGYLVEDDGSISLRFVNRLAGYPGWFWTVTVARVENEDPTVLEVELLPGDGALLAPEWVPWAERLADYRAHQAELAEQAAAETSAVDETGDDAEDMEDDDDTDVDDDFDVDVDDESTVSPRLHAGDLDGVDIDELDESAADLDEDESVEADLDEDESAEADLDNEDDAEASESVEDDGSEEDDESEDDDESREPDDEE